MSDYATTLANLCSGTTGREARIARTIHNLDRTEGEATIIEDAVAGAVRESFRAIGAAIDDVSPFDNMQSDALAILCAILPETVEMFTEFVLAASADQTLTTPGCDCENCRVMKAVIEQIKVTQGDQRGS